MSQQLVECIPGFSEGRRQEVIRAIAAAVAKVPGVRVLAVQSDADQNRSTIAFAGAREAVGEAAFQAAARAAELIDTAQDRARHPRLGATDVIPFIPISGMTMADCVALAGEVGRRIGEELNIPVYLYGELVARRGRPDPADVHQGQSEARVAESAPSSARAPDFGPSRMGSAGATAVGARQPLVAYNVYLDTHEVEVARRIAKTIRRRRGGLRYAGAVGAQVRGRAQVSLTGVNYRATPLHQVFELIRVEAARYGAAPIESELVGLVPQDALCSAAGHYLQLRHFQPTQILESKLLELQSAEPSPGENRPNTQPSWVPADTLRALAAGNPAPGGGAASALAGALAAALAQMVARLTVGRRRYAEIEAQMRAALEQLELLSDELVALAVSDSQAYQRLMATGKLPRATQEQQAARSSALQAATREATHIPLAVAELARQVLEQLHFIARSGNQNARSDAQVGALLAHAAALGACLSAEENLAALADAELRAGLHQQASEIKRQARELLAAIVEEPD